MAQGPLQRFEEFISEVSSEFLPSEVSQKPSPHVFWRLTVRSSTQPPLKCCAKMLPNVSQFFVEEIPKHLTGRETGDENPEQSETQQSRTVLGRLRRRNRPLDPSYRPPKSAKDAVQGVTAGDRDTLLAVPPAMNWRTQLSSVIRRNRIPLLSVYASRL